jgi:hypothetical protein
LRTGITFIEPGDGDLCRSGHVLSPVGTIVHLLH